MFLMACSRLSAQSPWQEKLARDLPLMGQHNWIVIADSAFPLPTAPGIEVATTGLSQTDLLTFVLNTLANTPNVRPLFLTDAELPFVAERDANGISSYRVQLAGLLKGSEVETQPLDQILTRLDDVARNFHVLVLKSTITLPYTAVFIQLESRYWSPDAEKRLRAAMQPK
jgi:hypothetical protein